MAVGQARLSSLFLFRLVSYLSCYNPIAATCLEVKGGEIYLKTGKYINATVSYTLF